MLAFHAKESPIRTRDEVFNLVSHSPGVRLKAIVRPSGLPLIQDSLTDKDPSKAIQDLSIGKIRPTKVKESTSSVQVEASTSRQGEPRIDTRHPQVGHTKTKKTRKYIKMNVNNLLLHHDKCDALDSIVH